MKNKIMVTDNNPTRVGGVVCTPFDVKRDTLSTEIAVLDTKIEECDSRLNKAFCVFNDTVQKVAAEKVSLNLQKQTLIDIKKEIDLHPVKDTAAKND